MSNLANYFTGDKDQLVVQTPYGKGLVIKIRSVIKNESKSNDKESSSESSLYVITPMKEIRLLDWENAMKAGSMSARRSKSTILYTPLEYPSVSVTKGDDVLTPYGRGRVIELIKVTIRKKSLNLGGKVKAIVNAIEHVNENGKAADMNHVNGHDERVLTKYQVQVNSWRLAGRSKVTCFLFQEQVKVVRKKTLGEMDAQERVDFAIIQKKSATAVFGKKQYQQALNLYSGAIDAVRFVQHDKNSSNECRADLFEIMVTCSNNSATCCVKLQRWEEANRFAKNALVLLDALYGKRGLKIHMILGRDNGHCDAKLFGEWRVKSHLIKARSMVESNQHDEALQELKAAKDIYTSYTTGEELEKTPSDSLTRLASQQRELLKLKEVCIKKRKAILKKERARARAMFSDSNIKSKPSIDKDELAPDSKQKSIFRENASDCDSQKANGGSSAGDLKASDRDSQKVNGGNIAGDLKEPKRNEVVDVTEQKNKNNRQSMTTENNFARTVTKKVSFASELEERHIIEDDDEEELWYDEHKEALILLGIGSLATISIMLGLRKGR